MNKGDRSPRILENCPHASQVKMMRVQAEDAKGPTYGRYLGSKLIGDEEFCMQVDAHMDFEDDWDKKLMDMWGACVPASVCGLCRIWWLRVEKRR